MNEQLIVKNFGPIKDATVDFKRVTVFIGPTGGGKSTLAKLAAVFMDYSFSVNDNEARTSLFKDYSLINFSNSGTVFRWQDEDGKMAFDKTLEFNTGERGEKIAKRFTSAIKGESHLVNEVRKLIKEYAEAASRHEKEQGGQELATSLINKLFAKSTLKTSQYFPAERAFVTALEYSWSGLLRDDIGLPKLLLHFANSFSLSRKEVSELDMPFLNVKYLHINGRDFIRIPEREEPLMLPETASGIQSVTPLLVLLEHLSRNTEQAQSFIIEEPELNLFPTAQFDLVKILVDKCARLEGQNDLVLTTHSPYVLTALNLLCYAFRIAQQDEATARKVAKLIPRHCWIDPAQFAAYYVDLPGTKRKQQVRSIINKKTGLIEENELDTASDELSGIFDKLVRLHKPATTSTRAK